MADDETLERPGFRKRSLLELVTNAGKPLVDGPHAGPPPAALPPASVPPLSPAVPLEFEPPPKKSDPLPRRGEAYRPYARFMNRLGSDQHFIHFVHGDFVRDGFSYSDLRRIILLEGVSPGKGSTLVLKFVEAAVTIVTIEGRNLDDLHYFIHEKMVPWVWELPKSQLLAADGGTVITRIGVEEMER